MTNALPVGSSEMLLEAGRYGFETMGLDPSVLIAVQATNAQALAAI